ncbi:MAG: hypothetical protein AB1641_12495 [Thermodesulfobacteriota bacterium]
MILDYQSSQQVMVRKLPGDLYECRGVLEDSLFGAEVTLILKPPALEIVAADYQVRRSFSPPPDALTAGFKKLIGVRAGQGLTRIVRGLIGDDAGSERLAALVLDAIDGLILSFTTIPLRPALAELGISNPDAAGLDLNPKVMGREHVELMAGRNPRLKDSCIAFNLANETGRA